MVTIEEARALQEQVEAKARELNVLMQSAGSTGIRFEVSVREYRMISQARPVPVVDVLTFISPNDLEAE